VANDTRYRRTVAFVGNCQAQTLANVYRRRIAPLLGDQAIHIEATPGVPVASLEQLAQADVVVDQKFDAPDPIPEDLILRPGSPRRRFPYVSGRSHWPFSGAAHVNAPQGLPRGTPNPYPAEMGDSLLNSMIVENVPLDEALPRYNAKVADSAGRIVRMAELHLERQRVRDAACGMNLADFIGARYRQELLFTTPGHLGLSLSRLLITNVFEMLDVPYALIDNAVRSLHTPPFPASEMPIHPGVAEILGLTYVMPDRRYRFLDEGYYTFAAFAGRYLTNEWVPEMADAMALLRLGQDEAGLPTMREALRRCPGTAMAWQIFAVALLRTGQAEEAKAAMLHALQLAPPDPDILAAAAYVFTECGDPGGAEDAARTAITLFPGTMAGQHMQAKILLFRDRPHEAAVIARMVVAGDPTNIGAARLLANLLQRTGKFAEREAVLRQTLALDPSDAETLGALQALPSPPAPPAPLPATRYRPISLAELADDPRMHVDGLPAARPLGSLPAGTFEVPPLAFGETGSAGAEGYLVSHRAATAWLLRNVMVHGPYGTVTAGRQVVAETLEGVRLDRIPGAKRDDDGAILLPQRPAAADLHTAYHLLGAQPDSYPHWLLDVAARFREATISALTAQPGAALAPIVLTPMLNVFWKWESLELILPATTARLAVGADGSVFVQRLLYVPALGGADWLTHPATGALFDAMRDRVVGAAAPAPGSLRPLFVCAPGAITADVAELAAQAERIGFERVVPAERSFPDQIRLFAGASHVIAAHGAELANLAFCRPGTAVCELRPERGTPRIYRHLAAVRGLPYGSLTRDADGRLDPRAFAALLNDPRLRGD